jgi:hypothetical protein
MGRSLGGAGCAAKRRSACPLSSKSDARTRQLAFVLFLVLLGIGVLAFLTTLNTHEDTMPPLPPVEPLFEDLREIEVDEEGLAEEPPTPADAEAHANAPAG